MNGSFKRSLLLSTEQYQRMIQERAQYNESLGEWQIRGVALAGNNFTQEVSLVTVN